MKHFLPVLYKDCYKIGHPAQYPKGTELVYSNITPRGSRIESDLGVIVFGLQYFRTEFLRRRFNEDFFAQPRDVVVKTYKRRVDSMLGPGTNVDHIGELHELGYLPIHLKVLPEGTFCPLRVPFATIKNTHDRFGWLTNMLETLMSSVTWRPVTSATTAFNYRKMFQHYAKLTGGDLAFVPWQGHDFSMRGMDLEAAIVSGAAHLTSFTGTDTVPALDFLEEYYGANSDTELIGGSVPATEHSVMCIGGEAHERETITRLLCEVYPIAPVLSVVWDTWDFWKGITETLPALKDIIMARPGKLVIRPDSGDPVLILCGDPNATTRHERMGLIAMLFEIFGGKVNAAGYRELDPHIGAIYGDSITRERQKEILGRLMMKGFASTNVVLGIGSFTYSYVTRDTYGQAIKATYGVVNRVGRALSKNPKTDSGLKRSASGLLRVEEEGRTLKLYEDQTWEQEAKGLLKTTFYDGMDGATYSLKDIRVKVESYL